jgi:PST family polysaccharide transporter
MPRRNAGVRSLLSYGGTVTINGLVVYVAYNLEKVLLGRYWGAETVGIYGRAYQLTNLPTDNLNSSVGGVAFAALSRLQNEPHRLRNCFLKIYSLILALTLPITAVVALFAPDAIFVILGPKWQAAAPLLRYLAPTIICFAMINPFSWLLFAIGLVGRSLKIALVIAPLVILGYVIGLPYGPKGVALGYSIAMALWVLPHIAWCVKGTAISFQDVIRTIGRPLLACIVAAGPALAVQILYASSFRPLPRLLLGLVVFWSVYLGILLYVLGQRKFYLDILRGLKRPAAVSDSTLVTA